MTPDQIKELFPHASPGFILLNATNGNPFSPAIRAGGRAEAAAAVSSDGEAPAPIVERRARPRSLAKSQTQKGDSGRVLVRVTSYRRRLLDEDNLAEKFHVDLCRYAGVIPSDAPDQAKIEVSQEKVTAKEDEGTLIEVFQL